MNTGPNEEAAAILAQVEPGRLDSLWLAILASEYGSKLLWFWDLTLEQVVQHRPIIDGAADEVVQWAQVFTRITAPSESDCAEYALGGLLASKESALCTALREQGHDVAVLLEAYSGELGLHPTRTTVESMDWYRLAHRDGRDKPFESEVLEICCRASALVKDWLQRHPVPAEKLQCVKGIYSYVRPVVEPIEPVHLALAMVRRWPEVNRWMGRVGVTPSRLLFTVNGLDQRLGNQPSPNGRKMSWLTPATEEARLQTADVVTPQHLLLGLMSDPEGITCRLLRQHGIDARDLRRQIAPPGGERHFSAREMSFSPDVLEICQQAAQLGGLDPYAAHFLMPTLEYLGYRWENLLQDLRQRIGGSLSRDTTRLSFGGVTLGSSAEQVISACGPPIGRSNDTWFYHHHLAVFFEGAVCMLTGRELQQDGQTILQHQDGPDRLESALGVYGHVKLDGGGQAYGMLRHGRLCSFWICNKSDQESDEE